MTSRADFTDSEWEVLVRAPMVAGMAITLADPGGPIEVVKETSAVLRLVTTESAARDDVVGEAARGLRELAQQRKSPLKDFKPRGSLAGKEILDELSRAAAIVDEKATPDEAQAFRDWLLESAQRAAEAAKEGGFMGFNAVRVSEGEQRMLDELRATLAAS
jgi:ABC-type Fe3+ transport system substrate-binding protein